MINLKAILTSLVFLFITFSVAAQTLSSKSVSELKTMKQEAIASEDYDLATKIKKELKTRITIDEKIVLKNTELERAVAIEDYEKADILSKEIQKLTANKIKIESLTKEKETALSIEDFDKVIAIDKEIKALKSLKPENDRPLTTEQEIEFILDYYQTQIDQLNGTKKGPAYLSYITEEQKQNMSSSYKKAKIAYEGYVGNGSSLSNEETNSVHVVFLTFLKLSKDEQTKEKYRQYFLKKVTKHTAFTLEEKIRGQISYYENTKKAFPKETPQTSFDAFNKLIDQNKDYLSRLSSLSKVEIGTIDILFNSIPLTEKSIELNSERVVNYFKPIPGLN